MLSSGFSAASSWRGYIYQGQVAVYYVIRKINKIVAENPFEWKKEICRYKMKLENWEDFEILYDSNLQSIHQVKALDNSSKTKYEDAIYELLIKIVEHQVDAFLHSTKNLKVQPWWNQIDMLKIFKKGVKEFDKSIQKFEAKPIDKKLESLKNDRSKKISIEKLIKKDLQEKLKVKTGNFSQKHETLIQEKISEVYKHIKEKVEIYFTKKRFSSEIYLKINAYRYCNKDYHCSESDLEQLVIEQLKNYFNSTKQLEKTNKDNCKKTFIYICSEIEKRVSEKSKENEPIEIEFNDIVRILNSDLQEPDESYNLFEIKQKLFNWFYNVHCFDCKTNKICFQNKTNQNCNLFYVINIIDSLSIDDFRKVLYSINPRKAFPNVKKLSDVMEALDKDGVIFSFYKAIFKITEMKYKDDRIFAQNCKNNKNYLASCIQGNSESKGLIVREIEKNADIKTYLNGIDVIVSSGLKNVSINKNRINEIVPKIDEIRMNKRDAENEAKNITNIDTRFIYIQDVKQVIKEFENGTD